MLCLAFPAGTLSACGFVLKFPQRSIQLLQPCVQIMCVDVDISAWACAWLRAGMHARARTAFVWLSVASFDALVAPRPPKTQLTFVPLERLVVIFPLEPKREAWAAFALVHFRDDPKLVLRRHLHHQSGDQSRDREHVVYPRHPSLQRVGNDLAC